MTGFVSYARQDNGGDDLQDHRGRDRLAMVEHALESARLFVAVVSPTYLRTAWTRKEFESAVRRDIPMMALFADGTIINLLTPAEVM